MTNKLRQESESLKEQLNKENTEKHLANVKRFKAECEVESLKAQLKSIRNSTIDECVNECQILYDKGRFYHSTVEKILNALKTPD